VELKEDPPKALVVFDPNPPVDPDPNAPPAKAPNPLAGFEDDVVLLLV